MLTVMHSIVWPVSGSDECRGVYDYRLLRLPFQAVSGRQDQFPATSADGGVHVDDQRYVRLLIALTFQSLCTNQFRGETK